MKRAIGIKSSGQTLMEFVITLPLFLLLVLAVIDFGRLALTYASLANATREGARYAVVHLNDNNGVENVVRTRAVGLNSAGINVVTNWNVNVNSPETAVVTVTATYGYNWIMPFSNTPLAFTSKMFMEDFTP
jgi:Flp pilus assembly protein TadG